MSAEREFNFTDRDFNFIKKLVGDKTGIVLADAKRQMVYGRLSRRLRELGLKDFKAYCNQLAIVKNIEIDTKIMKIG